MAGRKPQLEHLFPFETVGEAGLNACLEPRIFRHARLHANLEHLIFRQACL